jgi:hypothetical protein
MARQRAAESARPLNVLLRTTKAHVAARRKSYSVIQRIRVASIRTGDARNHAILRVFVPVFRATLGFRRVAGTGVLVLAATGFVALAAFAPVFRATLGFLRASAAGFLVLATAGFIAVATAAFLFFAM